MRHTVTVIGVYELTELIGTPSIFLRYDDLGFLCNYCGSLGKHPRCVYKAHFLSCYFRHDYRPNNFFWITARRILYYINMTLIKRRLSK